MIVHDFLDKNKIVIMLQLPHSPDLASADFFPLPGAEDTDERKEFFYD